MNAIPSPPFALLADAPPSSSETPAWTQGVRSSGAWATSSRSDAIARVTDLLNDAEAFARAWDFDAAIARTRDAAECLESVPEGAALAENVALAARRYERAARRWQHEIAARNAVFVARESSLSFGLPVPAPT